MCTLKMYRFIPLKPPVTDKIKLAAKRKETTNVNTVIRGGVIKKLNYIIKKKKYFAFIK